MEPLWKEPLEPSVVLENGQTGASAPTCGWPSGRPLSLALLGQQPWLAKEEAYKYRPVIGAIKAPANLMFDLCGFSDKK